jgi:molybdate transport system substrate-binding protein
MIPRRALLGLALSIAASLTLACEQKHSEERQAVPAEVPPPVAAAKTELMVFAASSLKQAFEAAGASFEAAHPGADIVFNFGGTQEIRRQLEFGARADVFASADEKHMQALVEKKLVQTPRVFAENEPVLAVFEGSATPIQEFSELPSVSRLVVGAADVPIGRYTTEILDRAEQKYGPGFRVRVESKIASRELNVRQVLAKVTLGEADAAVVYRSDVTPPRAKVRAVDIPSDVNVVARYPIAVVQQTNQGELARAWLELLRSPIGQGALRDAGFRPIDGS